MEKALLKYTPIPLDVIRHRILPLLMISKEQVCKRYARVMKRVERITLSFMGTWVTSSFSFKTSALVLQDKPCTRQCALKKAMYAPNARIKTCLSCHDNTRLSTMRAREMVRERLRLEEEKRPLAFRNCGYLKVNCTVSYPFDDEQ